jgi:alcohol dehydrogenase, propanol-preferring
MHAYAVPLGSTTIEQIEIDLPEPTGTEVELTVQHSGVCHSDVHLRAGYYDLGARGQMRLTDRGIPYPLVLGHEIVGVVSKVGPDVLDVQVGDLRLVYPWIGCGDCHRCAAGLDNLCLSGRVVGVNNPGGYAESVRVPHERYLLDIDGLDARSAAALACSGVTAFSAVKKVLPLPPTTPVLVIGAGGVGLTAIAVLKALGHEAIVSVDVDAASLAVARELGAQSVVQSTGEGVRADVLEVTGGPVEAVIDLVNNADTAALAFDLLTKGGVLVQVGLFGGDFTVPTVLMPLKVLTLRGSYVGTLDELQELIRHARNGSLPPTPVIDGELNLEGVRDSLDRLAAGGVAGRIVLTRSADLSPLNT